MQEDKTTGDKTKQQNLSSTASQSQSNSADETTKAAQAHAQKVGYLAQDLLSAPLHFIESAHYTPANPGPAVQTKSTRLNVQTLADSNDLLISTTLIGHYAEDEDKLPISSTVTMRAKYIASTGKSMLEFVDGAISATASQIATAHQIQDGPPEVTKLTDEQKVQMAELSTNWLNKSAQKYAGTTGKITRLNEWTETKRTKAQYTLNGEPFPQIATADDKSSPEKVEQHFIDTIAAAKKATKPGYQDTLTSIQTNQNSQHKHTFQIIKARQELPESLIKAKGNRGELAEKRFGHALESIKFLSENAQLESAWTTIKDMKPQLNHHPIGTRLKAALGQSTTTWKTVMQTMNDLAKKDAKLPQDIKRQIITEAKACGVATKIEPEKTISQGPAPSMLNPNATDPDTAADPKEEKGAPTP